MVWASRHYESFAGEDKDGIRFDDRGEPGTRPRSFLLLHAICWFWRMSQGRLGNVMAVTADSTGDLAAILQVCALRMRSARSVEGVCDVFSRRNLEAAGRGGSFQ